MKKLVNYINEKLLINKHIKTISGIREPKSLNENDIKYAWEEIFDDIHILKTGNIKLGKLLLKSTKDHPRYENNTFTLYPDYKGLITIRRAAADTSAIWCTGNTLKELTIKMVKLFKKEKYNIEY